MQPQGLDRTALVGILLMSLLLGVWMFYSTPTPEQMAAQKAQQVQADSLASLEAEADTVGDIIESDEEVGLVAPIDSAFAGRSDSTAARKLTVVTDRYEVTFSTAGATPVSFKLLGFNNAESTERVDLVSNPAGALAIGFNPPQGAFVDSRALQFRPLLNGQPFALDTLRATDAPAELTFETSAPGGAIRFVYGFDHDSYDIDFRVETPGTDVLAQGGGYELIWDGALPLAEADPKGEVTQAGAYLRSGGETEFIHQTEEGRAEPITRTGTIDWVAVKTKFFIAALIPVEGEETQGAELSGSQIGSSDKPDTFAQEFEARIEMPSLSAGESNSFTLYLGPLELRRLAAYGLYDTVDFGFGAFMTRPIARYIIAPSFAFLSTFIPNFGWVIIVFALLVKLVLWPLTSASYRSAAKMRELQPEMAGIKEKYPDDPQKQQEAMMGLYREKGVNPLGGCVPMLLQYPILIAMWRFFQSTLVLRGESFLWAADLSAPDPIIHLPFNIPFYGDFVAGFTLLMGASMIISMRLSMAGGSAITGQQKAIMYMMPAVFFLFFNGFPSGLSLYYLAFNMYSIVQQRMINNQVHGQVVRGELKIHDKGPTNDSKKAKSKKSGRGFTANVLAEAKKRGKK